MGKATLYTILLAVIAVAFDQAWLSYQGLRNHVQSQTIAVTSAVDQINEIARGTFATNLAQVYYMQGQLDLITEQTLGQKSARDFKRREQAYIHTCGPQHGILKCHREWFKAHYNRLVEITQTKRATPRLTPV